MAADRSWQAADMKVRIGYGLGTRASTDPDRFAAARDEPRAARLRLAVALRAGHRRLPRPDRRPRRGRRPAPPSSSSASRVLVLPGRNPMLLAKELATLDRLSRGRLLPAFGLGAVDPGEHQAFGVEREASGPPCFDEALPLLRRFWTGDAVDHDGRFHRYEGGSRAPDRRSRTRCDIWLGGIAPSELDALRAPRRRVAPVVLHPGRRPRRDRRDPGARRRRRAGHRPRALRRAAPLLRAGRSRTSWRRASHAGGRTSTRRRWWPSGLDGLRSMIERHVERRRLEVRRHPRSSSLPLGRAPGRAWPRPCSRCRPERILPRVNGQEPRQIVQGTRPGGVPKAPVHTASSRLDGAGRR